MAAVLALDQGTTELAGHRLRPRRRDRRHARSRSSRRSFPGRAGSSTTRRRSGPRSATWPREALARRRGSRRATSPPSASPTSARRRSLWDRDTGRADPQRDRLAGPPHRRPLCDRLREAEGARADALRARTGLVIDPYFSGTKLAWLLDNVAGRARAAEARRAGVRHRRHLADVAAHRRRGPRHRRHATPRARMLFNIHDVRLGRRAAGAARRPARGAAGSRAVERRLYGEATADRASTRDSDRRHRRRPAGRAVRPGLLRRRAWPKNTYGTGCFLLMNTGANAGVARSTAC